ncbi:MAG: hypothetical protein HUU14_04875 [Dehalococcoidia bacterium]|nr:hypothetical protein [Chloroflexi bacterium CFX7]MCK6563765.1 hypothetical protein [Dehalococcoidia bacterium]MCL4230712.1 hypothetical protein [Dehalococcoidia bacterium]NUQ55201.1 hypothetical protein [Dehalococcoidia bacterium]RIL04018.1 MAG: hypothetical protein DCC78_00030 [bacterium]
MTFPSPEFGSYYEPRWPAVVELNFSDEWRARWVDERVLPEDAPVDYAYVIVWMGGFGYVTRSIGETVWRTVEGAPGAGEKPPAFVKRITREQTGATGQFELVGFFECKATSHNPSFPPGAVRVRPLYFVLASEVKDLGRESPYERRRLPVNEHLKALRQRYPEFETYLGKAADRYAMLRK